MQNNTITTEWRIPSTYQEVEWIWRNGNNYIDTWWIPKANQWFEVKIWYRISSGGYRYAILSNYNGLNNNCLSFEVNSWVESWNKARFFLDSLSWNDYDIFSSNWLTVNSFANIVYTVNNWSSATITVNWTSNSWTIQATTFYNVTALLFIDRQLRFSTFNHDSAVSYLKIYENWTLIRDFIPCYRKSDNVIGLWERIWKQFHTNQGSWTFSKGWNV